MTPYLMRLVYRFFFIILGAALIPLLLTTLWLLRYQSVAKKNALELHRGLADFGAQTVASHIQNLNKRLAFTLDLQRIKRAVGMGFVEEFKVLQQVTNANPDFVLLSILDTGGKETLKLADAKIFPDPGYKDRSGENLFVEAKKTGRVVTGPVVLIDGTPVMNLVYPLEQAGYVYLTVSLRELWEKLKKQRVGLSGWIVLVDDSGRVLTGFEDAGIEVDAGQLKELFSQGLRGTADSLSTSRGAWVGAFEKVQGFPWAALTLQPKQEAFLAVEQIRAGILAWVLLISLAALGLSYAMAARIAEPIEYLTLGAARVAQKDMSVPVPELGWGELKSLSRSFNQMMKELKVYYDLQVEKIIEEKTKVETLVYTIPEGIVMTNFNGEVLYINVPAMSILGIPTDTTLESQKRVFELVRHESLKDLLQKVLQKQFKVQEAEVQIEEPSGQGVKYYSSTATLVSTPNKQDLGVMLMMRDVTAEKELEKTKEEFFHAVAHDLRAPLAAIQSYTKLLEKSYLSAGAKEKGFFDSVYRSCDKLMLLVSDILDLAKMEAGEMPLSLSVLEVEAFLKRVTDPLQPLAVEKGILLTLEGVDSSLGTLQADQRLMDRVITNLATNAIKFTPRGGKVAVGASPLGTRELEIYVADSGPGIPKDQLDNIFEKFKQLGGSQMRMGYGIGLSICKKVVELHKGAIWAESKVGRGSRFTFRIPRTQ